MTHNGSYTSPASATTILSRPTNDELTNVVMCTPVYADGPGTFKKALGDGSAKAKFFGVVADQLIAPATQGAVLSVGVLTASTAQWDAVCGTSGGLAYGTLYYLSTTTAGALTTSSASGVPVIFGLGPTVGAIVVGGGGGITNSASANVIPKSDGTNLVASPITDDGTNINITSGRNLSTGNPPFGNFGDGVGYPAYFYHSGSYSQNVVVLTEGSVAPTGTDERQAINAIVQGSIDTSAAASASVNSMAYQASVTTTRTAGVKPLNNIGIQSDASGGDLNYSFKSGQGTLRNDGPVLLGATTAASFAFDATNGSLNVTTNNSSALINLQNGASSIVAGHLTASTVFQSAGNATFNGEVRLDSGATDFYMYPTTALSSSAQRNIYLSAGGTNGVVRINANTGGIAHTGTGGLEIWPGNNGGAKVGGIDGNGMVYGQASADATESLSASGAASIVLGNTFVSGAASNLTLANGSIDGQCKTVTATSGTGQVTPAAFGNGTKMTWSAGGQSCTLMWGATNAKWWLVSNVGMTVV